MSYGHLPEECGCDAGSLSLTIHYCNLHKAAPDLLAALKKGLEALEELDNYGAQDEFEGIARKAIAKAEGHA